VSTKNIRHAKNVRWSDKCPEDPKNNKWMYRRIYLQADQTEENVENPSDRYIRRQRNVFY